MKIKQLFLATMAMLAFSACVYIPEPPYKLPENGSTTESEDYYINETFASSFGVFSTEETVGNYPWVIDYSTAKATSYVNETNNEATSWLISSPVDFTNETEAYVTFDYIIRYSESGKVANNHQLLISTNYSGNAAEATWTTLPYNAVEGSDWVTFYKANVDIPAEFLGKSSVVFALRYTATSKSSTWEVKNFKVAHGKAETAEPETPEEASEYTVAEALAAFTGTAKPAAVKGYIVGTINGQIYAEGCVFSGLAESKTNLLLADNPEENDYNNCMPIQLPSGKVRDALNLVDNPGNYKKQVTLTGSLEKYFGVPGLKSVTAYTIDGVTPEEPETPNTPEGAYISESFSTSFGAFTTQETVGSHPWIIDYSTAKMTSYLDTDGDGKADKDHEATSWLVSPSVDFTNETEAYVAFEYIIRYAESGRVAENHQLLISDNFTGDVATATWTNLPYNAVEGSDWNTFYKANVNIPAEFIGKANITFALRYTATTKAGTWEVRNFVVAHGNTESTETPDTPETPETPEEPETPDTPDTPSVPTGDNLIENGSFEEWNGSNPTGWGKDDSNATAHSATISKSTDAHTGSYAVNVSGYSGGNKRLASKSYTLPAGTYTLSAYIKQSGSTAGAFRMGYAIIKDGAIGNSDYKYLNDPTTVSNNWQLHTAEFTLTEETEITALVMNSKVGNGAAILVDDIAITAN